MLPPPPELPERAPRLADGRYVLLARIGRGGMAGVYAAWDLEVEEWRAIKVLLPKQARDASLRTRFEREGATMQALHHPNLVRVYEVGAGEKLPFLVMELIASGSLYRWTKTWGAMPPRMAVEAMIQLCEGLSEVHASGVVHRDIKPRNVLIDWNGVLKLTDFGIAQLEDSHDTRTGLAMGTLGFMSPEQLHDSKSVDLRTDIYAIGATLWTQLTARKARDLFRLEDKPDLMDGVPEVVQPLLLRCLAYEREDRYASARALSSALHELFDHLPDDPPETPPLPLNLSLSFKSKPENTFSEILTTMNPDDEPQSEGEDGLVSVPPPSGPPRLTPIGLPPRSRPPALRSAAQRMLEPETELPSYLVGVEQPSDIRRAEVISLPGEPPKPAPPPDTMRTVFRVVATIVLVPVGLVVGASALLVCVLAYGTWGVRAAGTELTRAQEAFANQIESEAALRTDLLGLGAETGPIEQAFARWTQTTDEPDRTEAALEYLMLAEQEAGRRIGLSNRSHEQSLVNQRLSRLDARRAELLAAEDAWVSVVNAPAGRLAVALHLARPEP